MAGSTHRASPKRQEVDRKMTTTSSGGAVLLHYADCKYVVLGNRNMKAAFLCAFPPNAELATMQDGNLQGTRLLMA